MLEQHCADLDRDPSEIKRSAQAMLVLSDDPEVVERARGGGRPVIAGNVDEVKETIQRYVDAGVDELIVPDFNLGPDVAQRKQAYDRFIEEVAPEFR